MSAEESGQGHVTGNEPKRPVMATAQQQQMSQDPEEKKFMERFALFMEQQGFITKKQDVGMVENPKPIA